MSLSGKLLPLHIHPGRDELCSSWLVRLARSHRLKPHTFSSIILPGVEIWTRDIDRSFKYSLLETLHQKTATPLEIVYGTTLKSYEGYLAESINGNGIGKWVLAQQRYHRTFRKKGVQFCPICLSLPDGQFYRKKWRLALSVICPIHECRLLDCCLSCSSPIMYQRTSLALEGIHFCSVCGSDLSGFTPQPCGKKELACQRFIYLALDKGWINIPHFGAVYSVSFFEFLHRVLNLLCSSPRRESLIQVLRESKAPGDINHLKSIDSRQIEKLNQSDRYLLLQISNWLFEEWPYRFVEVFRRSRIWRSWLVRDMKNVPYWAENIILAHLYCPSANEYKII